MKKIIISNRSVEKKIEGLYSYDQEMPWQLHIILNGKIKVSTDHIMNLRNRHDSPTRDTNLRFKKKHIAYMGPIELLKIIHLEIL